MANREFFFATGKFAETHPEIIQALNDAIDRAAAWTKEKPAEVAAYLSRDVGVDPHLLEVITRRQPWGFRPVDSAVLADQQRIADTFFQLGLQESVNFKGEHLEVRDAKLLFAPVQRPYPDLYFGGSSLAAHEVAGKHIDVYLTWGEPPREVAEKIADVRKAAAVHGRSVRFGIRLHIIVRETENEAWAAANDLIRFVTDDTIAAAQKAFARFDSAGKSACRVCTPGKEKTWRLVLIFGQESVWFEEEQEPHWLEIRKLSPRVFANRSASGSTVSFFPGIRISRKPTVSLSCFFHCSLLSTIRSGACLSTSVRSARSPLPVPTKSKLRSAPVLPSS